MLIRAKLTQLAQLQRESEIYRLATYLSWPSQAPVRPSQLTRWGFIYEGTADQVRCVFCDVTIANWKPGDNPAELHRSKSPNCSFIKENFSSEYGASNSTLNSPFRCEIQSANRHPTQQSNVSIPAAGGASPYPPSSVTISPPSHVIRSSVAVDRTNPDFSLLRSKSIRLDTFHDWPPRTARIVDPRDLVKAGLFYTGHTDRVQCAFCRGYLRNWVEGDKPIEEHRKHFPDCPFLRDISNVYNVSTAPDQTKQTTTKPPAVAVDQSQIQQAKHPQFSDLVARIQSFSSRKVSPGQTAEGLAAAGFYYVGPEDNVRCFWCNGGLKNFQSTDNPQTEHARWFPRCNFIQQNTHQPPVTNNQTIPLPSESGATAASIQTVSTPRGRETDQQTGAAAAGMRHSRDVEQTMNSPTVKAVLAMDFPRQLVSYVVQRQLATITGNEELKTESLLDEILQLENEPEKWLETSENPMAQDDESSTILLKEADINPLTGENVTGAAAGGTDNNLQENSITDSEMQQMLDENHQLKEARTCKVCMDAPVDTVFLPCGHLVCCSNCSPSLRNCAICRALIRGTVKIFLA